MNSLQKECRPRSRGERPPVSLPSGLIGCVACLHQPLALCRMNGVADSCDHIAHKRVRRRLGVRTCMHADRCYRCTFTVLRASFCRSPCLTLTLLLARGRAWLDLAASASLFMSQLEAPSKHASSARHVLLDECRAVRSGSLPKDVQHAVSGSVFASSDGQLK